MESASLEDRKCTALREVYHQAVLSEEILGVLQGRPCRSRQELIKVVVCTLGTVY